MFRKILTVFIVLSLFSGLSDAADVRLETGLGNITLRLYEDKAPISSDNFIRYVVSGFYDNTVFHRVIKDFMIQGGGTESDLKFKTTRDPIINESSNGLSNKNYTIAMARSTAADSATSQFYINTVDNLFLDKKYAQDGWGYAVFGEVIEGKDVVDAIESVKTTTVSPYQNVPVDPVVISKAMLINPASVCMYVSKNLDLNVFCVEYQGIRYGFTFNAYQVADDPSGLYWKMDSSTFQKADHTEGSCIPVGNDLEIKIPCASYQGTDYEFTLNYSPVKNVWKMDKNTFKSH